MPLLYWYCFLWAISNIGCPNAVATEWPVFIFQFQFLLTHHPAVHHCTVAHKSTPAIKQSVKWLWLVLPNSTLCFLRWHHRERRHGLRPAIQGAHKLILWVLLHLDWVRFCKLALWIILAANFVNHSFRQFFCPCPVLFCKLSWWSVYCTLSFLTN